MFKLLFSCLFSPFHHMFSDRRVFTASDMFSPHECPRCRRWIVECSWPFNPVVCLYCTQLRNGQFLRLGQLCRNRGLSLELAHCIDQFCFDYAVYSRKSQQLWFLKCVLLSNGSEFRKFTFYYGRRLGNIGEREDIIDRVLSFL